MHQPVRNAMEVSILTFSFCSAAQIHGERCTEGFYRENLAGELQGLQASEEDKQKMLLTLQRLHVDEEAQPLGEEEEDGEGQHESIAPWLQPLWWFGKWSFPFN